MADALEFKAVVELDHDTVVFTLLAKWSGLNLEAEIVSSEHFVTAWTAKHIERWNFEKYCQNELIKTIVDYFSSVNKLIRNIDIELVNLAQPLSE